MAERRDKKPAERPDYLNDFPEEFEQHPDAPSRDLARRAREPSDRTPAAKTKPDSALARIESMKKRLRDLAKK